MKIFWQVCVRSHPHAEDNNNLVTEKEIPHIALLVAYLAPISYLSLHFHGIRTEINPQNWVFCSVRFISPQILENLPNC